MGRRVCALACASYRSKRYQTFAARLKWSYTAVYEYNLTTAGRSAGLSPAVNNLSAFWAGLSICINKDDMKWRCETNKSKSRKHRHFNQPLHRFECITNLMRNFIYSIIILHHDPLHVSSIAVLIFRRTNVYLQYLVSAHSVCRHPAWDDTRYCKYTIVLLKVITAMHETCWGSWCNINIE
jgi:hypothetical protein